MWTPRFRSIPAVPFLALFLIACAHPAPVGGPDDSHRHFDDAEAWAARFEDPRRDQWQKPDDVIKLLALQPDAVVADLGSATGYFAIRIARTVPEGKVYGVDIESSMVDYLKKRAEREELLNLTAVLGRPEDPMLPEPVDLVMVVDTYHHIGARPTYFKKLLAAMRPQGRLVIIDFSLNSSMGPPSSAKVDVPQVLAELETAGWKLAQRHDLLPEQYFLVFTAS
jgi:cyclopropane fatty-acyl-phospholipid synthase-like methyltransferase